MKKNLIVGLGNIGEKYDKTRHNIGFKIVDALAKKQETHFENAKLGSIAKFKNKGRSFLLLKPNTYVNLSGKAVKYWMQKEKIALENILVIADDLNIDFGTIRFKPKGSAGGHNGLKDIETQLNSQSYPRFRFGVGASFSKGKQIQYVIGKWSLEEENKLVERVNTSCDAIVYFGVAGIEDTMNIFNGKYTQNI